MSTPALLVLIITLVAALLLISSRLRPDLIALVLLVVLGISGLTSPTETFAGFSGVAVMTILGISIISEGLRQTGVTNQLGNLMIRLGGTTEWKLVLVTTLTSAVLSLFMNNIAAVGVLLPAVMSLSRKTHTAPSRLLIPLAFGTTLGGMATLLTTANIIVSGTLKDAGLKAFGLLDFFPIGAPIVLIGAFYLATVGRRLLPKQQPNHPGATVSPPLDSLYAIQSSLRELNVLPESPMVNLSIAQADWARLTGLTILGILRARQTILAPSADEVIRAGDHLLVQGEPAVQLLTHLHLVRVSHNSVPLSDDLTNLVEAVIAPHGSLPGKTLRSTLFRDRYHVNVLAIWRESRAIQTNLSEIPLEGGDTLLIQGTSAKIHLLQQDADLILLAEDPDAILRPGKGNLALTITLLSMGLAATGLLPVASVVMLGAVLMLLFGCMSMNDVYRSIEWKAIFLIAGMWPLSTAIRSSGLAEYAAGGLLDIFHHIPPLAVAALLILVGMIITQFMSAQVAALVLAPLALATAQALGSDPRAMGMAVALGCSLSFPTPFGHPVNLMVMSTGGYTVRDYVRIGVPLTIIAFIFILIGLRLFWGL